MTDTPIRRRQNLLAAVRVPGAVLDAAVTLVMAVAFPAEVVFAVATGAVTSVSVILIIALAGLLGALGIARLPVLYLTFRDYPVKLRLELRQAARKMGRDELWLARDEHLVLASRRSRLRLNRTIAVFEEDDMVALGGENGADVSFTATVYTLEAIRLPVERRIRGCRTAPTADGHLKIVDGLGTTARARGMLLSLRITGGGRRYWATEDELRELIRLIGDAELLAGDQPA
jgi:hypothetical protein